MDGYGRRLTLDLSFDAALAELTTALADQRLTILGQLDVHEYLERTVHHDCRRYALLCVTAPHVVLEALRLDVGIGPLLVTTIAVFELADGETAVSVSEPLGGLASNVSWRHACRDLAALADRACDQLARALSDLEAAARTRVYLRAVAT